MLDDFRRGLPQTRTDWAVMPGKMMPDRKLPPEWFDHVVYRADTLDELAMKIGVDPSGLSASIQRFNVDAVKGADPVFDRGGSDYDRFWGDRTIKPNPSIAPLVTAPYYAIRLEVGDLGTKGGLATNRFGQVLGEGDVPIDGLYAAGNCAASILGNHCPGPGGTLAPALTQAFLAAEHVAALEIQNLKDGCT